MKSWLRVVGCVSMLALVTFQAGCGTPETFQVREVQTRNLPWRLPKYKVAVAFHFNRPADPATLRRPGAVRVDLTNTGSNRVVKDVPGRVFWKEGQTVAVYVTDEDVLDLLGPLGAAEVEYNVRLIGGGRYVTDGEGEALDGDQNGEPGGIYAATFLAHYP